MYQVHFNNAEKSQSLFRNFKSKKEIDPMVLDLYEQQNFDKGQSILSEGNKPLGLYFILNGKVKINKHGVDNKEQIIRILGKGKFFGYKDLMIDCRYSISADAFEDSTLVFIPKCEFLELIKIDSDVARHFTWLLCRDLMNTEQRLIDMVQKPVRERVAVALLELEEDGGNIRSNPRSIIVSRSDLANLVGSVKETVIRILSDFKSEHLISTNGSKIDILNSTGLHHVTQMYH